MPVYNTSQYLRRSIESVLNQTFKDFELICINDGSTDNSLEILQEYATTDPRIKIINQENKGLSGARNSALEIAQGEYIAFIDSDDFYATDFLDILYKTQKETNLDIVGCNFQKIKTSKDTIKPHKGISSKIYPNALKVLLHPKNFIHFNVWNKLYTKAIIGNIKFVPNMYYEDWVFNCQVFLHANGFAWIDEKLYGYNISDKSIMRSSYNEKKIEDYAQGINEVYKYFSNKAPNLWLQVKKSRISRTVKMMMNSALRSKKAELITKTKQVLQELRQRGLITYHGLSTQNKIKLFKFLH